MKKISALIISIFFIHTHLFANTMPQDTITRAQFIHSQTVKSDTLNQMALKLTEPGASKQELEEAIRLIMKGLHNYSRFRDSVGLRETFDHLAYVYLLQKKTVQAKWFYIQSNSMARDMRDTTNIIRSLLALSGVKVVIKDYSMAIRDLREAAVLAKSRKGNSLRIEVQTVLADYYSRKGDFKRAGLANDTIALLKDSVKKIDTPVQAPKAQPITLARQQQKTVITDDNGSKTLTILISVAIVILLLLGYLWNRRKRD
jgi:hypothetical protein